jgi:hypothetical protein
MDTSLVGSPVYQQLNQRLRTALAKLYRSGDQFLINRATANKALASLVSEGFLEFRKGLWTFVRRDVIDYDVRALVSFIVPLSFADVIEQETFLYGAFRRALGLCCQSQKLGRRGRVRWTSNKSLLSFFGGLKVRRIIRFSGANELTSTLRAALCQTVVLARLLWRSGNNDPSRLVSFVLLGQPLKSAKLSGRWMFSGENTGSGLSRFRIERWVSADSKG